jgi:hypothetical protein
MTSLPDTFVTIETRDWKARAPYTFMPLRPTLVTVGRPSLSLDRYVYYVSPADNSVGRIKVEGSALDMSFAVTDPSLVPMPSSIATAPTGDVFVVNVDNSGTAYNWVVKLPLGEAPAQQIMLPESPGYHQRYWGPSVAMAASPFMLIRNGEQTIYGWFLLITVDGGLLRIDFDVNGNQLGEPYKISGSTAIPIQAPVDVLISPQGDVFIPDMNRNSIIWLLSSETGDTSRTSEIALPAGSQPISYGSYLVGDSQYLYLSVGNDRTDVVRIGNPRTRAPDPVTIAKYVPDGSDSFAFIAMLNDDDVYVAWYRTLTLLPDGGHGRAQALTLTQALGVDDSHRYVALCRVEGPDVSQASDSLYALIGLHDVLAMGWRTASPVARTLETASKSA